MPIHFRCTSCGHLLSIGRRKAGIETACPLCHHPQKVPHPTNAEPPISSGPERAAQPCRTVSRAARFVSLTLGLAMLGLLGGMMWAFPHFSRPPGEQRPPDDEQLANLARINPLLQPEVEISPRNTPVPLPTPRPLPPPPVPPAGAQKPPSEPLPVDRKPDTSPPPGLPSPANDTPKKKPPSPPTKQEEADAVGDELVKAAPEQQDVLLEKLRTGKGSEYTQALAAAIGRLSDAAKSKARQALAERLTRFTSPTLLAYLGSEDAELRRATALALGMKDDKDHISELIDLLEDPDPSVVRAAHASLKSLTSATSARGAETAAEKPAEAGPARTPPSREKPALPRRPTPSAEEKAPATDSPASRKKGPTKDDDLPDVALVPPEETSPEMKAFLRAAAVGLSSGKASERIKAAQTLGELGEQAKPARRLLCAAMLDPVVAVRVAAADALKNIDPKMHYLAVVLANEKVGSWEDASRVATLLGKIQKLEDDGEPLAPLVAYVVKFSASNGTNQLLLTALTTLSRIGRKDLSSYRVVASALTHRDPFIRTIALRGLVRMKHGKLAVSRILALLRIDLPVNRIAAIEALVVLADESTEEIIAEAIAAQRYHNDEGVRRAVETALNKLENKQNP
jgi:HEAT repeat protein/phage FluMu protein Com